MTNRISIGVWRIVLLQIIHTQFRIEIVRAPCLFLVEGYMRHVHFQRPPWTELYEFFRLWFFDEDNRSLLVMISEKVGERLVDSVLVRISTHCYSASQFSSP